MLSYAPVLTSVKLMPLSAPLLRSKPALGQLEKLTTTEMVIGMVWTAGNVGLSAYHGYKRNRSVGWAAWWGLMGLIFPVVTPAVAIAQGFGKRA